MVTAYEKKAGAKLTFKEKPKLFVKKPVYRPRLPRKPRDSTPAPKPQRRRIPVAIEKDEEEVDYKEELPEDRLAKIHEMTAKPRKLSLNQTNRITRKRRHLLFMNPGETVIQNGILSFVRNTPLPAWARPFRQNLRYNRSTARLMWFDKENTTGLPFALFDDKRSGKEIIFRSQRTLHYPAHYRKALQIVG